MGAMSQSDDQPDKYIWRRIGSEVVCQTPYQRIDRDRLVHPLGHELDYFVVRYPRQAVGVVAVDGEGRILLVRQWRHTVQKLLWETPAGAIEQGEDAVVAAGRELREETGYAAGEIRGLYHYHPTIGSADQTFNLFLAHSLVQVGTPDPKETYQMAFFGQREIDELIEKNLLVDGMSLMGILLWRRDLKVR
jgi:ADP-ribose pyrophosphatase